MSTNYADSTGQTQYADARSARFAYRRIGPRGGVPLVLLHRFRGTLDWWDPEFLDALSPIATGSSSTASATPQQSGDQQFSLDT